MQEKYDLPIEDSIMNAILSFLSRNFKVISAMVGIFMFAGLGVGLFLGLFVGMPFFGFGTILTGLIFAAIGLILGGLVGLALGVLSTLSLECFNKPDESNADLIPIFDNIPKETWEAILLPLNRKAISSVMRTCSFFAKNKALADIRNNKPCFDVVAGSCQTLLLTQEGNIWLSGRNSGDELELQRYVSFKSNNSLNGFKKYTFASLENGEHIIQAAAGNLHTILLTSKGNLWTFESDSGKKIVEHYGQEKFISDKCAYLGWNTEERIAQVEAYANYTLLLTTQGNLFVREYGPCGQQGLFGARIAQDFKKCVIVALVENEYITQITTGVSHTLLLTNKGSLFAIGSNSSGQLGLPDTKSTDCFEKCIISDLPSDEHIVEVAAGVCHTLLLTNKGTLWGCGHNILGQLSISHRQPIKSFEKYIVSNLNREEYIVQVVVGDNHSLLLTNQGNLLVCGANRYGQLGLSHNDSINRFEKCMIANLLEGECVVKMIAGSDYTLLITNKSSLFVCGKNDDGQLGLPHRDMINRFEKCTIDHIKPDIHDDLFLEDKKENSNRYLIL